MQLNRIVSKVYIHANCITMLAFIQCAKENGYVWEDCMRVFGIKGAMTSSKDWPTQHILVYICIGVKITNNNNNNDIGVIGCFRILLADLSVFQGFTAMRIWRPLMCFPSSRRRSPFSQVRYIKWRHISLILSLYYTYKKSHNQTILVWVFALNQSFKLEWVLRLEYFESKMSHASSLEIYFRSEHWEFGWHFLTS